MDTVNLDCSSGRGRRAPLSLSGLVVSCPVRFLAPLPPCFVRVCLLRAPICGMCDDGGGGAVPCTLIYDRLKSKIKYDMPRMSAWAGDNTTLPNYTSTRKYEPNSLISWTRRKATRRKSEDLNTHTHTCVWSGVWAGEGNAIDQARRTSIRAAQTER